MTIEEFKEMLDEELKQNKIHYANDIYEMISKFGSDDQFLDEFADYLIKCGEMLQEYGEMLNDKGDIFH